MATFKDFLDSGLLANTASVSPLSVGLTLVMAFLLGMFIFQVYKKSYQSVVYTKSFNLSLVMMTMVTSLVILAITANVVLSLGMVGALSIVRFRSAIKDPMDIVFMFWSIAAGIMTGAGFYVLAVTGSLAVGIIVYGLSKTVRKETPYLLLVNFDSDEQERYILDKIKTKASRFFVKSKTVSEETGIELVVELQIKDGETGFVSELNKVKSVTNTMLVGNKSFSS